MHELNISVNTCALQILTNLEELSFLTVLAFPKAREEGREARLHGQKDTAAIILAIDKSRTYNLQLSKISTEAH